MSRKLDFLNR